MDARRLAEADVKAHVAAINLLIGEAFDVRLSDPTVNEVAALIANVAKTVAIFSAELSAAPLSPQQ